MVARRDFLGGLGATALTGASLPSAASAGAAAAMPARRLLSDVSAALLDEYPEVATFAGLDSGAHAALHGRLTDRSPSGVARRAAACGSRLSRLRSVDQRALSGTEAVNVAAVRRAHEVAVEGYAFGFGDNAVLNSSQSAAGTPYAVSQGTGFFASIPDLLDTNHKVEAAADAEAYLARLTAFARGLDDENERMRRDAALGSVAPDFLLDITLKQQTGYRARPVPQWGLVTSLATRATRAGIAGDWRGRAEAICTRVVAPALDRQIAMLTDLRRRATAEAGCWKVPDGDAYYRWALRASTTTAMSPDEVHALGLAETKRIGAEMDRLLVGQGLTRGTVGERMTALGNDPRFLFPNTDAGKAQLLAYLTGVIASVRAKLPQAFATLRRLDLAIRRVPIDIEAGAPDGYELDGPLDGSRPATYYINLRNTANWPKFSLPTLCFHEGLPGHAWQGAFARALPPIRTQLNFTAYTEGWALYAEQLGDELGMYADDPFGRLGYLQSMQFRACRLVVDTGLHAKRWTREQAIRWMVENNGNPEDAARGEIDRYCAWPGQACGYQIGHLEIERLRTKAQKALGARFDLRRFNDVVVGACAVPLDLLAQIVDRHIGATG